MIMKNTVHISIIIINYNTWHYLEPCIRSIYKFVNKVRFEIIVVDNASTDDSVSQIEKHFPEILLIKNGENFGFAKANNQAIAKASGHYLFLLNADTLILNDKIDQMIKFLDDNTKIGLLGPTQKSKDHLIAGSYSSNKNFHEYKNTILKDAFYLNKFSNSDNLNSEEIRQVGYVNGAAMIIRRELIDMIGLLDERFFFMAEEVDFAFRCHRAGFDVVYYPEVEVLHYGASGQGLTLWGMMQYHYSNFKLFEKYGSSKLIAALYFFIWLLTRSLYSLFSLLVLKDPKVNKSRLFVYIKSMIWYLSFGKIKFSVNYR